MEQKSPIAEEAQTAILRLIGLTKLLKAILLLIVGLAALHLVHHDVAVFAHHALRHTRSDPDSKFLHSLIAKISGIPPHRLEWFGVGAFIYSALYFTEGIGLLLTKRWAEWLAVITTSGFIPLELYEIFQRPHWLRIVVLIFNLAIVAYLIFELKRKSKLHAAKHKS